MLKTTNVISNNGQGRATSGAFIDSPAIYTGCPKRKGQNFGRVFLMLKYTDITQNTYIQSWTVTEIITREV
jgi:hypothetical protein